MILNTSKYIPKSVYHMAAGLEDDEGNLLSPARAIFSALNNILANFIETQQEQILGREAYYESKILMYLAKEKKFQEFLDVAQEACSVPFRKTKWNYILLNAFPRQIRHIELPIYENELKLDALEKSMRYGYDRTCRRLVAAKLKQEYFPVTEDFIESHFNKMDIKMGLDSLL